MSEKNESGDSGSNPEKKLIDLVLGKRKAKSKADKKLLREVNAIKKKGKLIEAPYD